LSEDAWIDVEEAAATVHEAESALRDGELGRAIGSALVANAIARRPFLSGDTCDWAERRRADRRSIRVRALEARSRVLLANGDAVGAATDAQIVTELETYRETAHLLLMRAHVLAGNPAQALAAYEHLRRLLDVDLGTRPTAETEAVFLDILSADVR
jgi:DNA-binding SARP family transcriptional activator